MLRRVMAGIGLSMLAFGLIPLLTLGAATPKQGMVVTKDNPPHTFIGEVDDTTDPTHVNVNSPKLGKVSLDKRNVERVTYFNTPAEEFNARLLMLDRKDNAARIELANFAITNNMYPQARELLVAAVQLEPANRNAADMLKKVDDQIKSAQPPETKPAVAPAPANAAPARPGLVRARRTLTPDEINWIRQNEWSDDDQNMIVKVSPEAKNAAIASGIIDKKALGTMTPGDIAWEIVKHGPPALRKDVKMTSDPGTILSYRSRVHRWVISTCATGACHNTDKGGKFYLFTEAQNDATIISDYVILQQFAMTIGNVEYQMIDRLHPENSLLTQFALPPNGATIPHPKSAAYPPPAKAAFGLEAIKTWISKLPAVVPTYDVDLSVPPPKPETRPSK